MVVLTLERRQEVQNLTHDDCSFVVPDRRSCLVDLHYTYVYRYSDSW